MVTTKIKEDKIEIPEDKLKGNLKEEPSTKPSKTELKELEKAAEAESLETKKPEKIDIEASPEQVQASSAEDIKRKKKELLEKVKKIKEKIEMTDTEALKAEVKAKKKADMLIPDMKPFVYRRRADGLAIFNTDLIDQKLKEGAKYLSKFDPKDVILVCKRQVGWKFAKKFEELTGIRTFTKKYPAGILTNIQLKDFFETELTIVTDGWLDKNALKDTLDVNKKVLMICGTNNFSKGADQVIIGNNKSGKSLGLIFYLLAREYCKAKKIDVEIPDLEWWIDDRDVVEATRYPQKKERRIFR